MSRYIKIILSFCSMGFFLAGGTTAFASSLGQPVQLVMQDGVPRLGFQYAYELTGVSVTITGTVIASSIPAGRPLYFRFLDSATGALLSDWAEFNLTGTVFTVDLADKAALQALKSLPNVVIVFSTDKTTVGANLDVKSLCTNFPRNFVDLTLVRSGCSPDKSRLDELPDKVGGVCSADLHRQFCSSTYDDVRDAIARQYHCVFQCK